MTGPAAQLDEHDGVGYLSLHCPGCGCAHTITVALPDGPPSGTVWEWDGNLQRPTISPSILTWWTAGREDRRCHSFVRDGIWEYLTDSTHPLAGQHVPVPAWDDVTEP